MATNENVNKVIYGNQTVMDITDTTAEEADVASGEVFYKADGSRSVGTLNADSAVWGNISGTLSDQTDLQTKLNQAYTIAATETSSVDDLDLIPVEKISASSNGRRNIKFRNLKSILKGFFDDIYQAILTFDNTPTVNSDNPVKSSGIYNALMPKVSESLLKSTVGWTGKNKLKIPSSVVTKTTQGITYTVTRNSDREVIEIDANGTATADANLDLVSNFELSESAIMSGCPISGSDSTYRLIAQIGSNYIKDLGDGVELPVGTIATLYCQIRNGQTVNHLKFYPMIRDASITDDTYEPYHESVEEEIEQIYADNGVLGAKNLLKIFNMSYGGVDTFVNSDGSITSRGTKASSGGSNFRILEPNKFMLPVGKYKLSLSGTPANTGLRLSLAPSTGDWITKATVTSGNEVEFEITSADLDKTISMFFVPVEAGTVIDWTYYPMLRLASDPDSTYVPYAMTNRELTEKVQGIIDAANNAADFAAFKTAIASL